MPKQIGSVELAGGQCSACQPRSPTSCSAWSSWQLAKRRGKAPTRYQDPISEISYGSTRKRYSNQKGVPAGRAMANTQGAAVFAERRGVPIRVRYRASHGYDAAQEGSDAWRLIHGAVVEGTGPTVSWWCSTAAQLDGLAQDQGRWQAVLGKASAWTRALDHRRRLKTDGNFSRAAANHHRYRRVLPGAGRQRLRHSAQATRWC